MKKSIIVALFAAVMMIAAPAMAKDCNGPDCSVAGNFDVEVGAIGGGIDADLEFIPNGAAGGIGAAGGLAGGQAEGAFESFDMRYFSFKDWKWHTTTVTLGGAEANLGVTAGGATNTNAYDFTPEGGNMGIGVGSETYGFGYVYGHVDGDAWGLAYSEGGFAGIAGQGSLDGSVLFDSPLCFWDSKGMTYGLAGQGSVAGIIGGGAAAGLGDYEAEAEVNMSGNSYSDSYRAINSGNNSKTETMGSNVGAFTSITSYGNADSNLIGTAFVNGGYVAAGNVASKTVQFTNTGAAKATAYGSYSGAGELGCGMKASAVGYTQTRATTYKGMTGSVMSSEASMKVQNVPNTSY
jgi:hypothetical protein